MLGAALFCCRIPPMILTLIRTDLTPESTIGNLIVPAARPFSLYTLELPVKDGLPGSAIPEGMYPITFRPSPKFLESDDPWVKTYARRMPHIEPIERRSEIMLHWLNTVDETEGCVGVGLRKGVNLILDSRVAFAQLFQAIYGPDGEHKIVVTGNRRG